MASIDFLVKKLASEMLSHLTRSEHLGNSKRKFGCLEEAGQAMWLSG